jgi:hypothetical protein
MQVTIHTAFITDGKHAFEIVSASHDDLITRIGDYCRQHWSEVSSGPPPENLKVLVDAYFASADASIEVSTERSVLPEPYASAPKLLSQLGTLVAALSVHKSDDGSAYAAVCGMLNDARFIINRATVPSTPRFTVFCQETGGKGTIHIDCVEAADLEAAIIAGKQQCIDDWSDRTTETESHWNMETVHCLGVAAGDVGILHWEDQAE